MVKTAERISIFLFVVAVFPLFLLSIAKHATHKKRTHTQIFNGKRASKSTHREHDKKGANVLALKMKVEYVNRLFIQHDYLCFCFYSFALSHLVVWHTDWIGTNDGSRTVYSGRRQKTSWFLLIEWFMAFWLLWYPFNRYCCCSVANSSHDRCANFVG